MFICFFLLIILLCLLSLVADLKQLSSSLCFVWCVFLSSIIYVPCLIIVMLDNYVSFILIFLCDNDLSFTKVFY